MVHAAEPQRDLSAGLWCEGHACAWCYASAPCATRASVVSFHTRSSESRFRSSPYDHFKLVRQLDSFWSQVSAEVANYNFNLSDSTY